MRSILSRGRALLFLLAFTCFACGGGGGGGVTTLAELTSEIDLPSTASLAGVASGPTAIVILEVRSDGTIDWSAAVPPGIAGDVTGLTLNRASDASVFADLLGVGTFDPVTGTATGTVTVSAGEASDLADNPGDFLATLLTSTNPPASGGLVVFEPAEWHTVLLGSNESPVADADARGAATFRVTSPTRLDFVIAMLDPVEADVTLAHIHVGPQGTNGLIVLDLEAAAATGDAAAGTLSGTVTVDGETLARIAADLPGFYCNVHTAAAPNGIARGQLDEGTVEMTAALVGSAEVPIVVEGNARGGATFEFDSLTGGRVLLALDSGVEDIGDVIMAHIHAGDAGVAGPILVGVMGADYATDPSSYSAESTFTYSQKDFTRILANPTGFYCNLHTTLAQAGLVRGQLSTDPRTVNAILSGAEETPPVAGTSGTMRVVFTGVHSCAYTINMTAPAASAVTQAHIHDAPAGAEGLPLVDLFLNGDAVVNGNVISGTAAVPGRTQARMLAGTPGGTGLAGGGLPSLWHGDVHTVANPNGAARGQFTQSSIADPPAGLAYTSPVTYLTAAAIPPNSPTSTGGAITNYSVSPPLPPGLGINATTGVISGTPTATRAAANYTVTASNASGSTTATVNITVNVGPPTLLLYTTPVTYVVGQAITPNTPASTGGAISTYSVAPPLPANLSLNTGTGVITGTPAAAQAQTGYVVTGSNTAGSVTRTIQITITLSLQPPSNLSYSAPNPNYPSGYAITDNVPTVSGGTVATWSVSPALPAGLTLGTDGKITGTPTTVTAAANYVVTATNASGSTTATLNITISLGKPGPFSYSNDYQLLYNNSAINTMSPSHTGGGAATSYSLTGTLPNGLSFSTSTGAVSGTPSGATATGGFVSYTVTATNSTGSTTGTFNIWMY